MHFTHFTQVCILVDGDEKSSKLLDQNDTKLLPLCVTMTCVVCGEEKQAMLHQLLSVGKLVSYNTFGVNPFSIFKCMKLFYSFVSFFRVNEYLSGFM